MKNRSGFALLGAVATLALLGAGCQKYAPGTSPYNNNVQSNNQNNTYGQPSGQAASPNDVYDSAMNLDLPDDASKAAEQNMRSIAQPVFGDVKISSFLNSFPNESSLSVEYTAKRPTEQGNLNALQSILKDKGYTIDMGGITDGNATVTAHNGNTSLIFSFKLGDQKISVSLMSQSQGN